MDEQDLSAFAHCLREEVACLLQSGERLTQINDVNAVASVEDEPLHFGVPPLGLMTKVNARFQQFFNSNTYHNFPLLRARK
jgi:hypothetical protein